MNLLAAVKAQLMRTRDDLDPTDRADFERDLALARGQLRDENFEAASSTLTLDEALELALRETC